MFLSSFLICKSLLFVYMNLFLQSQKNAFKLILMLVGIVFFNTLFFNLLKILNFYKFLQIGYQKLIYFNKQFVRSVKYRNRVEELKKYDEKVRE